MPPTRRCIQFCNCIHMTHRWSRMRKISKSIKITYSKTHLSLIGHGLLKILSTMPIISNRRKALQKSNQKAHGESTFKFYFVSKPLDFISLTSKLNCLFNRWDETFALSRLRFLQNKMSSEKLTKLNLHR